MKRILSLMAAFLTFAYAANAAEIPTYPGGAGAMNKYITENLKYPPFAKDNGVEGVVTVGFMVQTDGSLKNLKVVHLVDPDLEKEAMRLVGGMPAWIPAEKDGVPVEAPSQVEIPFVLE